jgi:hypothetical protein
MLAVSGLERGNMAEWTVVLATVEISICVGAPAAKLSPLATNAALLLPETHLAVIVMLLLLFHQPSSVHRHFATAAAVVCGLQTAAHDHVMTQRPASTLSRPSALALTVVGSKMTANLRC